MKLIQPILLLLSFLVAVFVWRRFRSKLFEKMMFLLIICMGGILVIFPDLSRLLAKVLGVGRGVDLVIYLGLFGLAFLWLVLYSKYRTLEEKLTKVTRALAILEKEDKRDNC